MKRLATVVLALALCATFSFADYHHHVDEGQQPDSCSACALASLDSGAAPPSTVVHTCSTDHGPAVGSEAPRPCPAITRQLSTRGPPASH